MNKLFRKALNITILIVLAYSIDSDASVFISEIMPNPVTGGEWVEIYNSSSVNVSLTNWRLIDRTGNSGMTSKSPFSVKGNTYAILAQDSSVITELSSLPKGIIIVMDSWTGLNNDGDELLLQNANRQDVDQIAYGAEAAVNKGRSWEKIDLKKADNNNNNWGQCASMIGHTAGKANSLYISTHANKIKIFVDPNPFSPDGDGDGDIATISFGSVRYFV